MAVLDIILLLLFIPSIVRGVSKGFIEQLAALVSIFLSAYLAYLFAGSVSEWLSRYITLSSPSLLYVISFAVVVVLCVLLIRLLARILSKALDSLSLGWIDRLLGFVLAVFNTALVIGLIFVLFNDLNTHYFNLPTDWMEKSFMYGWISKMTDFIFPFLKNIFAGIGGAVSGAVDGIRI